MHDDALPLGQGKVKADEWFGEVETYRDGIRMVMPLDATPEKDFSIRIQGCADEGLCYPPRTLSYRADQVQQRVNPIDDAAAAKPSEKPEAQAVESTEPFSLSTLLLAYLSAFLGGMILNLMPCVFPVLSIKVLQFAQFTSVQEARKSSLAYLAGSVASFVLIAALMLAVRASGQAVGWGFQLQNSVFVAFLVYLFFTLGFEYVGLLAFGSALYGRRSVTDRKEGPSGRVLYRRFGRCGCKPVYGTVYGVGAGRGLNPTALGITEYLCRTGFGYGCTHGVDWFCADTGSCLA